MKTSYKFLFLLSFLILFTNCEEDTFENADDSNNDSDNFLIASIRETCQEQDEINFEGEDIYGYPLSDPIIGDYWQFGGHNLLELGAIFGDLGINIVVQELDTTVYDISDSNATGTAFIYYIDSSGNEFGSTTNNTAQVEVIYSYLSSSGKDWIRISISNDVEVYNAALDQTKCIHKYSYSYIF